MKSPTSTQTYTVCDGSRAELSLSSFVTNQKEWEAPKDCQLSIQLEEQAKKTDSCIELPFILSSKFVAANRLIFKPNEPWPTLKK